MPDRITLHRYPEYHIVISRLNPLEDICCWIQGLKSISYLKELARAKHGISGSELKKYGRLACSFVEIATEYLDQAFGGPSSVAFLPLYYAFLNLSKACIVLGPYREELPKHRLHGASYPGAEKDSRGLETEEILLHPRGTIALLYKTLTDGLEVKRRRISLSRIYPYILDIEAEYRMITGHPGLLRPCRVDIVERNSASRLECRLLPTDDPIPNADDLRHLKAFSGLRRDSHRPDHLVSKFVKARAQDALAPLRQAIRPFLLYVPSGVSHESWFTEVPVSSSHLLLPEELPILLAFFHLSSVVRYKPEFHSKLMDSRYWPLLLAMQKHSSFKFLTLFWSFVHQTSFYIL